MVLVFQHTECACFLLLFFCFCVPQLYLWASPFWVRFLRMWPFFNPTIEVVTFHLHGWCMLGVFLLPAFIHLGHECQDLLSPCDGMHVCTDKTSVYTFIRKSLEGMESQPKLNPREKSPLPEKFSPEEDQTHDAASSRTASPTHNQLSYSGPTECACMIQDRSTAPGALLDLWCHDAVCALSLRSERRLL